MDTFVCSAANCLLDCSKDLVVKHICYVIKAGENVEALKKNMELLLLMRSDVTQIIQTEKRQQKVPTEMVQGWQRRVDDLERDVSQIVIDYDNRSCRCCVGGCSFNCRFNYQIGRKAFKKLRDVETELKRGEALGEVTVEAPLPPVQGMPSTSTVPGLEPNLQEALFYLQDNSVKEELLGIWGTGGIGKTTLLEKINNALAGNPFGFNHVISIVASKECTTEKLQRDIIKKLRLSGGVDATSVIFNYLSNKNFVLLLDDVWERLDLEKVGIPHPLGAVSNKLMRKVILTTRSEAVCGLMGAHRRIRVDYLEWDDAWRLFREKVGEAALKSHPSILGLAEKVAKECKGLPLALITIGRAMSSKKTPEEWNHALGLLQKSRLLQGTEEKLFSRLKLSYDYLENKKMQECFLCCSMWPEDHEIIKEELIECWMGHGLIEGFDNINEAYNEGHSIIGSLQAACLLEPVDLFFELANTQVKMHDMIRDMALWIVSERGEKWMVHAGVGLQEPPQEAERWNEAYRVSLMHNKLKEALLPPSTIRSSCQNLTTLLLQSNYIYNPNGFKNLQYFNKLKYLDLSRNVAMESFPIEICELVDLEYLNLSLTRIKLLPEKLKNLVNLKYLLLRETRVSSLPDGVLSNLKKLLVLDVFRSISYGVEYSSNYRSIFDELDWMKGQLKALGIDVSTVSDLDRLIGIPIRSLKIERMEGMTSLVLLSLLPRHNCSALENLEISKCNDVEEIIIQKNDPPSLLEILKFINNRQLKEIIWKGVAPKDMLPMLRDVRIFGCHEMTHTTWAQHLPCLEYLGLTNCKNMKVICEEVEQIEENERPSFPCLRILDLNVLPELGSICDCALIFPSLEFLDVHRCPKLKELPFKAHTTHSKLRKIGGHNKWWERLRWKDDNIRTSLLPLFAEYQFG